ncbi:hypothetical protein PIB30_010509 [Stylosanthes scabra]|uniref:Uncharacterized protein n=1 Tax=Stylosanthes scabra TaxID=79078 RepID=A0ABU6Q5K4_9FABA|nr:hypothetical protein [Stylosanthes scabra]
MIPHSSTTKTKGSSALDCSPKPSGSPVKSTSSLLGKPVKHKSPYLWGKMKTIPNTPNDPVSVDDEDSQDENSGGYSRSSIIMVVFRKGVAQDVIQDNPQVVAKCENILIQCSVRKRFRLDFSYGFSFPFQAPDSSNLSKEFLVFTSCDFAHDEFEYFHDDAKALCSRFASLKRSFVLPVDLNPLFKKLGDEILSKEYDSISFELNTMNAKLACVSLEPKQLVKTKELPLP